MAKSLASWLVPLAAVAIGCQATTAPVSLLPASRAVECGVAEVVVAPSADPVVPVGQRSLLDRPDDQQGLQLHMVYVLPNNSPDEALDVNGGLAQSITRANDWLAKQAGGAKLRVDTYQGQVDVGYLPLPQTDQQMAAMTPDERFLAIRDAGRSAGLIFPNKVPVYVYGGIQNSKLGELGGDSGDGVALVFPLGIPAVKQPFAPNSALSVADLALLHESLHALGFCSPKAPNGSKTRHTYDDIHDLMAPSWPDPNPDLIKLDVGHNDYFGHGRADLPDLARSSIMVPSPAEPQASLVFPLALEEGAHAVPLVGAAATACQAVGQAETEAAVLQRWNAARQAAKVQALPMRPALQAAARLWADKIATVPEDIGTGAGFWAQAGMFGGQRPAVGIAVIDGKTPEQLADALMGKLLETSQGKDALADAEGRTAGIGVVVHDNLAYAVVGVLEAPVELADLKLGEGPSNTYTLSGRLRLLQGEAPGYVTFYEDVPAGSEEPGMTFFGDRLAATWRPFYLAIPRMGTRKIAFEVKQGNHRAGAYLGTVNGDKPLDQAYTLP